MRQLTNIFIIIYGLINFHVVYADNQSASFNNTILIVPDVNVNGQHYYTEFEYNNNTFNLKNYKLLSSATGLSAQYQAKGTLSIPKVIYNNKTYSAELNNIGNNYFSLTTAQQAIPVDVDLSYQNQQCIGDVSITIQDEKNNPLNGITIIFNYFVQPGQLKSDPSIVRNINQAVITSSGGTINIPDMPNGIFDISIVNAAPPPYYIPIIRSDITLSCDTTFANYTLKQYPQLTINVVGDG